MASENNFGAGVFAVDLDLLKDDVKSRRRDGQEMKKRWG